MAISLRSVGASPGANSSNCIITKPVGLALGDFMLAHIVNKATSGTITPPANWTIIGAQSNTASSRSALFYKFADSADVAASTFTFTLGTTGRNRGEMGAWLGVNTTTPINVANQQINSAGTSIAVPSPTVTTGCLVLIVGSNASGGVATACSGSDPTATITLGYAVAYSTYCALACFSGVKAGTDAIDAHSLSTFTSAVSSGHAIALNPQPPPEEHSGTAAVSGKGLLIGMVQKNGKGSSAVSENGSLIGVTQKGGKGFAITSGKGALVAIGIAAMMGLASLSGGGSQVAAGLKAAQNVASISAGGSLTATGEAGIAPEEHSGVAAVSGAGSLVASGAKAISISASISGAGSLIGGGLKAGEGLGAIHANGSLITTGTAVEFHSGIAVISGDGTLAASGIAVEFHFGDASISGNGSFVAVGLKAVAGTAGPISANGAQVAEGRKTAQVGAVISGSGALTAIGEAGGIEQHSGIAAISGSGSLSSAGIKDGRDSAVISGNGSIIATGEETKPENYFGVAFISGGCHLTASGTAWWYDQSKRTIKRRSPIGAGRSINPTRSIQLVRSLKRPEIRKKTTRRNYP